MAENNGTPLEDTAGFCMQWGPEKLAEIERGWEDIDPTDVPPPSPPMANVALAIECASGAGSERDYEFQGRTYTFRPTLFSTGLQLLAWQQRLHHLHAMGEQMAEHLLELKDGYRVIAEAAYETLIQKPDHNPFLDGTAQEFHLLLYFLLDPGNELRIPTPRHKDGPAQRYDAVHYYWAFRAAFGEAPETWRRFQAGITCLRRLEAERSLQMFEAFGMTHAKSEEIEKWATRLGCAAGQDPWA